jgi:hypothetical protein
MRVRVEWGEEKQEDKRTSRASAAVSTFFLTDEIAAPSLWGDKATAGDGRGDGVEADATATLAAPPETRTSLRRAGE